MKTILFRAKKITDNQWVNGGIAIAPDETVIILTKEEQTIWNVIPETVGQFIGLTDKNGHDIFEGDIVKMTYSSKNTGKIIICGQIIYVPRRLQYEIQKLSGCKAITAFKNIEIIGNIHDNPELLNNSF